MGKRCPWKVFGKPFVTGACLSVLRLSWFWRKKGSQMFLDGFSRLNRKTRDKRIQIRIGIDPALESKYNSLPHTNLA